MHRRRLLARLAAALAAPALARGARAQAWPSRPIRAICPFSPGSTIDILGRIVTEPLGQALAQTVVVENRGGAGGTIGSLVVAKSEPDGYTLLINASAHSAAPASYPNIAYDPAKDFSGIAMIGVVPNVLLVAPGKNIRSARELAERGKAGDLTYGSAGVGSASHWGAERFRLAAGFAGTHVPFRGGPEAITEVITGRVDFACLGTSSSIPFIRDGRLVALAVTTRQRSAALPDVPTTLEAGFPDSDYTFWNGFLGPARMPKPIIGRLADEISKVLAQGAVKEKLAAQGVEPFPLSPDEFDALIRREIASNLALAKAAGLKFN
ncbi:MAG TPA: tripartite tricarboxylate transporter substrate binding protein [Xanthobacteraceae bacterium]|nr:tripartite tricarboxylate transporter substrate binding protein [Xanthobacteraceae bacterium]